MRLFNILHICSNLSPCRFSCDSDPCFFCLSKRNKGKKTTPYSTAFGFPALLSKQGVCGTRPNRPHTPLACRSARTGPRRNLIVHFDCSARRQWNRIPPKIAPLHHCTQKTPLSAKQSGQVLTTCLFNFQTTLLAT